MAIGTNFDIGKIAFEKTQIAKVGLGDVLIYSAGNTVTYCVDTNITYTEEVDADETVLSPKTFIPSKDGWEFVGWKQDVEADGDVLEELIMGDEPVTLYAVFQLAITLSYNGNGGSGSTAAEKKQRYYNNGTVTNPNFTLQPNSFVRSGASFLYWAMGSVSGAIYNARASITLTASTIFYAKWQIANASLPWSSISGWSGNVISYDSGYYNESTNKILYNIDTTKYSGYTLSINQTTLEGYNSTIGIVDYYLGMNGTTIRSGHTINSSQAGTSGIEDTGTLGYGGKSFSITVNNVSNISISYVSCSGSILAYGSTITLLGKIV